MQLKKDLKNRGVVRAIILIFSIVMSGCASTEMKSYIGKDIREVVLTNGQPLGALDMGNGVRAFQFIWGGTTTTAVRAQTEIQGNSEWFGKADIRSSGSALMSNGCIVAYLTRYDDSRKGWIIFDYRIPQKLVC